MKYSYVKRYYLMPGHPWTTSSLLLQLLAKIHYRARLQFQINHGACRSELDFFPEYS